MYRSVRPNCTDKQAHHRGQLNPHPRTATQQRSNRSHIATPHQLFGAAGGAGGKALRRLAERRQQRNRFSPYNGRAGSGGLSVIISFPLAAEKTDGENAELSRVQRWRFFLDEHAVATALSEKYYLALDNLARRSGCRAICRMGYVPFRPPSSEKQLNQSAGQSFMVESQALDTVLQRKGPVVCRVPPLPRTVPLHSRSSRATPPQQPPALGLFILSALSAFFLGLSCRAARAWRYRPLSLSRMRCG